MYCAKYFAQHSPFTIESPTGRDYCTPRCTEEESEAQYGSYAPSSTCHLNAPHRIWISSDDPLPPLNSGSKSTSSEWKRKCYNIFRKARFLTRHPFLVQWIFTLLPIKSYVETSVKYSSERRVERPEAPPVSLPCQLTSTKAVLGHESSLPSKA